MRRCFAAARGTNEALHEYACLLGVLGRLEESFGAFIELLGREPGNFGWLNDFATLLYAAGFRPSALSTLMEAVRLNPGNATAHANLGGLLLSLGELGAARSAFLTAALLDPANPAVQLGLEATAKPAGSERTREPAAEGPRLPGSPGVRPIRLLIVQSLIGGNVDTRELLAAPPFEVRPLFVEEHDLEAPFPDHDVVFNAVGDADRCRSVLRAARALLDARAAAVVNRPSAVLATARCANAARLSGMRGVVSPRAEHFPRRALEDAGGEELLLRCGFAFPLLVRSPGFHTGNHFEKVERARDLAAVTARLPGEDLIVSEFVDVASPDGNIRKYRVMIVDGKLYPLHLAISKDWKVHYFSADMAGDPNHRAEERRFLDEMPAVVGEAGLAALGEIAALLGLDYAGIDFSIDRAGRIVVFEANATMVVPLPDANDRCDERRAAVARILAAVRDMLLARASRGTDRKEERPPDGRE